MIKVLAHGYPYTKFKCNWCRCEFEATDDEILTGPCSFSQNLVKMSIKCPNCGNEIIWQEPEISLIEGDDI